MCSSDTLSTPQTGAGHFWRGVSSFTLSAHPHASAGGIARGRRPSSSAQPARLPVAPPRSGQTRPADAQHIWQTLRHRLSPNARLILQVLEEDGAAFSLLLRHYGGQALRIPRRLPPEQHELRRTLGTDMLRRLMAVFGGTTIYVPRCRQLLDALHRQRLIARFDRYTASGLSSGAAVRRLAIEASCSERRVWQILKTCDNLPPEAQALPDLLSR